ncbi:MAG: hypothetical protein ACYCPN_02405 [Thermoplasmata archaeon]
MALRRLGTTVLARTGPPGFVLVGAALLGRLAPGWEIGGVALGLAAALVAQLHPATRATELPLLLLLVPVGWVAVTLPPTLLGEAAAGACGIALLGGLVLARATSGRELRRAGVFLGLPALVVALALFLSTTPVGGLDRIGWSALLVVAAVAAALYFWGIPRGSPGPGEPTS